jgi:hypothetical protein
MKILIDECLPAQGHPPESWRSGAVKALERQFAALAEAVPVN